MEKTRTILYIHGMGGGADSRIPSILSECLAGTLRVVVRTYDFDPDIAQGQISSWIEEMRPFLLVGESLGATLALVMRRRYGLPAVLVSPALNAPAVFGRLAPLTRVPLVSALLDRLYRPRPGERQALHFAHGVLRRWAPLRAEALAPCAAPVFAFFGTRDHYRRSGIVSLRTWRKHFGTDTYGMYDGSHFMEETYVRTLLADRLKGLAEGSC